MLCVSHPIIRLLVLMLIIVVSYQKEEKKGCEISKLDKCAHRLIMLSDRTFVFPENLEQMNKRCKEIKTLEKCIKDYTNKCMTSTTRSTLLVLTYSIAHTNKGYCANNKQKMAFAGFGPCANRDKKELERLMDKLTNEFSALVKYKDTKLRIPLACCAFHRFKTGLINAAQEKCIDHTDEVETLVDGYSQDTLRLVCGDYSDDNNKCDSIISKMPTVKRTPATHSFIIPMAAILNSV